MGWSLTDVKFVFGGNPTIARAEGNNVAWVCSCGTPVLFIYQNGRTGSGPGRPTTCAGCNWQYYLSPSYGELREPPSGTAASPADRMVIVQVPNRAATPLPPHTSSRELARTFYDYWLAEATVCGRDLAGHWTKFKAYNELAFSGTNAILERVAGRLQFRAYLEYYCLDAVLFSEEDLVPTRPTGQTWLRRIRIAFEHEHRFGPNLFEEIAHLMITDCDLRVLVSYPGSDEQRDRELAMAHHLISGSDRATQISESSSFLMIFGKLAAGKTDVEWEAFTYSSADWMRVGASEAEGREAATR